VVPAHEKQQLYLAVGELLGVLSGAIRRGRGHSEAPLENH
jgi:hypothetical protein